MTSMLYSAFSAFQTSELFTFSDTLRWVPSLVSLSVKMSRGICDNIKLPNSRRQNTSIFVNRERSDSHLLSYQRLSFFLFFRLQWSFQLKAISRHIFVTFEKLENYLYGHFIKNNEPMIWRFRAIFSCCLFFHTIQYVLVQTRSLSGSVFFQAQSSPRWQLEKSRVPQLFISRFGSVPQLKTCFYYPARN